MRKYFGLMLFVVGFSILVGVLYVRNKPHTQVRVFSPYTLLTSSWEKYKIRFINQDGRVIDYSQGGITTSEGQSYALLQAVWMDDKSTFDRVLNWTFNNLKRGSDNLFGWRWGQLQGEQYGLLGEGGENSASDADSDIALALILADRRWRQPDYINQVKPILTDLWEMNTATDSAGNRYLIAGNWAQSQSEMVINPSYFAPYAWRLFASVDPDHDWLSLIDPAYRLLTQSSSDLINSPRAIGLPPDWVVLNKSDGTLKASDLPGLTPNYSFDAIRIPWRIALDYSWNQEPRAKLYLESLQFLADEYIQNDSLPSGYTHDGKALVEIENPAMYATTLAFFKVINQAAAEKLYQEKIIRLYSNDTNSFRDDLPYYEENWLWFGAAFYQDYLVPFN